MILTLEISRIYSKGGYKDWIGQRNKKFRGNSI